MKYQSKKYSIFLMLILFTVINFIGCTSSRLIDVWKDQSYKPGKIKNILVIAINNNKTKRRLWEKTYVDAFHDAGVKATPSYNYYPNDVPEEKDIPNLFKDNYDGIVLIQKVSEENRKYRVPGQLYYQPVWLGYTFGRRYVAGYRIVRSPGYIEKETVTQIETTFWEPSEDGKMIWSAITESVSPTSPLKFSEEVSDLVVPKMINDGIIFPKDKKNRDVNFSF